MRFTVSTYRPHPGAKVTWILHDAEYPLEGQIATFMDRAEAVAAAAVLSANSDDYDAEVTKVDPYRGAF